MARKLARAVAWLDDVERRLGGGAAAFAADADNADLAAFHLQLALQECVDLAAHWVAAEALPPPASAAATFDALAVAGRLDPALAGTMRGATSLRNRIAHGYGDVDLARLHREASEGLPSVRRYLAAVAAAAGL